MFNIGQRWFSEAEPELGLGVIESVEAKTVRISYPQSSEVRTYGQKSSPLKRYTLKVGETAKKNNGEDAVITDIKEENNILFYILNDEVLPETELSAHIDLEGAKQRVLAGNYDSENFFRLKFESYLAHRNYQQFEFKGFLGAKIKLIPHQVYIVDQVLKMNRPKVMLCDEVGLGKTIEASLILHSLHQKEIISSALIIVPESLSYQWFVELYRKFNMIFDVFNEESEKEDFSNRLIISSKLLNQREELLEKVKNTHWDMLIVDESHQINFSGDLKVPNLIKDINKESFATLFLSATPEVLGAKNLFSALNVLDPQKFSSFEDFSNQIQKSIELSKVLASLRKDQKVSKEIKNYISTEELKGLSINEIESIIVDRFGTGRSYFRNSRSHLENFSKLFTKRIFHPVPIKIKGKIDDKIVFDHKLESLFKLIQDFSDKKILVLCHAKNIVLKLQKELNLLTNTKIALFHSDQSLMERDRQAAFFADPEGARILLSTEVGSEGRNFEFADQLVLFDLPKNPDQLEQRIGRLDRIGQKFDVNIHLPFIQGSFEETLYRWYHEVLNSFQSSPKGANLFYKENQDELNKVLTQEFNEELLNSFITRMKKKYLTLKSELENGRDILVESNSYNDVRAKEIIQSISDFEQKMSPQSFLEKSFNDIGVDITDLNESSYFIKPSDNMLIPSFPSLHSEGVSITYQRDYALVRDDLTLISLEHPIYKGAIDLSLNSSLGNAVYIKQNILPRNIYFEFIITLQCVDEVKHISSRFLPFTPMRVLLSLQGEEETKKYPKKFIDENIIKDTSDETLELVKQLPKDIVNTLFAKANALVEKRSLKYKTQGIELAQDFFKKEVARLQALEKENSPNQDIETLNKSRELILKSIQEAKVEASAIRVILPEA